MVIGKWAQRTKPATTPVVHFLKTIRDLALHEGTLDTYATRADFHRNEVIIERNYDVARYDEQGHRHDLLAELQWAFDWLENEMQQIEAQLRASRSWNAVAIETALLAGTRRAFTASGRIPTSGHAQSQPTVDLRRVRAGPAE